MGYVKKLDAAATELLTELLASVLWTALRLEARAGLRGLAGRRLHALVNWLCVD